MASLAHAKGFRDVHSELFLIRLVRDPGASVSHRCIACGHGGYFEAAAAGFFSGLGVVLAAFFPRLLTCVYCNPTNKTVESWGELKRPGPLKYTIRGSRGPLRKHFVLVVPRRYVTPPPPHTHTATTPT